MRRDQPLPTGARSLILAGALLIGAATMAVATEPCGDFGECKALIEINSSDGDIGFHFLTDGDDLVVGRLRGPDGLLFHEEAMGPLAEQFFTELFVESAEPLCWEDPGEPGEDVVTLEEFLDRFSAGLYVALGKDEDGELAEGVTELTYKLPAAPQDVDFDGSVISWDSGDDLGNCATSAELTELVMAGILPVHPEDVEIDMWEIVLEPDVEDGDPTGQMVYSIRVPGDIAVKEVEVPAGYLASLPDDTPVKIEIGGIGGKDNATFTEEDGFCVNEVEGCEEE